jgi:hypothetical protein
MRDRRRSRAPLLTISLAAALVIGAGASTPAAAMAPCAPPLVNKEATPAQISAYFKAQRKRVVTFLGYSGAGYEDPSAMLKVAAGVLSRHDPQKTIVNIGATPEGIGAVYQLAKERGFATSGIVSTQWRGSGSALSPCVDSVFLVKDDTWGGLVKGTQKLSPTSTAMVGVSDELVAIGGGEVSRDEAMAAERARKPVQFIPADQNHAAAIERAKKRGEPVPTDFSGALAAARKPRK